jgi:hypothetical protein
MLLMLLLLRACGPHPPAVAYLVPKKWYYFEPPAAAGAAAAARKTAQFETFWFCSFGSVHARVVAAWQQQQQQREERLASGFKERRGQPGWYTALDEDGLLFGKPVPTGWRWGGGAGAS